ncbi:hypothetical protein GCM10010510_65800 [Streptomyces anandii JCM 4720]|nr:hypothetical protein GCM10010510_65800 [Streptomyces anandii JCM 4720]
MTTSPPRTQQPANADGTRLTARDAMHSPGPQVDDHMAVDVSLSVLIGARVPHPRPHTARRSEFHAQPHRPGRRALALATPQASPTTAGDKPSWRHL